MQVHIGRLSERSDGERKAGACEVWPELLRKHQRYRPPSRSSHDKRRHKTLQTG
eukprot:CAMPEP_0170434176 /NCGR_PEP_ID=MMETSP0117_2-20130122/42902_1 /TAXON_ID=400756 /ORGANISM="Durinskia baltica, Strain CSIRO CS-38" /LENGTH=53 /DNA_ID=CAMNT_0010693995 /DNA_START=74 /DNA_END=232 /DNA_ORIENTATION=+